MAKKKIKDKVKDFINSVKEDVKNGVSNAIYLPLLPFLPIMRRALQKSGYKSTGDLQEVSERFFHEYIKNMNYDYEHVRAMRASGAGHSFDALTATQIAQEILPIIRQLLEMFKKGDEADREALRESDAASEVLVSKSDKSAFSDYLPLLLIGLTAFLIFNSFGKKS